MNFPWHPGHIKELLDKAGEFGVPNRVCLNGQDYADIRKFGRDTLDIITDPEVLKTGLHASLFGIGIYVSRQETPGIIRITDRIGKTLAHWNNAAGIDLCGGEICDCPLCLVTEIMVG